MFLLGGGLRLGFNPGVYPTKWSNTLTQLVGIEKVRSVFTVYPIIGR